MTIVRRNGERARACARARARVCACTCVCVCVCVCEKKKSWQMGSAMLRSMVLGTVAGLECCILNGEARPKHTCVNSSLHSPCECTSPHAYAAESNNKSNGNKYAASEDRAHDLKIMRPTRCQLRYRRY